MVLRDGRINNFVDFSLKACSGAMGIWVSSINFYINDIACPPQPQVWRMPKLNLALVWNVRLKSQMPISPEHAFEEKSTKLLILLPIRTIYNRTFQCETPCKTRVWGPSILLIWQQQKGDTCARVADNHIGCSWRWGWSRKGLKTALNVIFTWHWWWAQSERVSLLLYAI